VDDYLVECWNCTATYNAAEAVLCNHTSPTTVCPFCLKCFCGADEAFRKRFWEKCPPALRERRERILSHRNPRLGDMLVKAGKITRGQLEEAIRKQAFMKKPLGEIFVMMGVLTVEELHLFLADQKLVEEVDLEETELDMKLVDRLGAACCVVHRMVPLELYHFSGGEILRFAVQSPDHITVIKQSRILSRYTLIPYVTSPTQFKRLFEEIVQKGKEGPSGQSVS